MNTNGLNIDVTRLYDIADEILKRYQRRLEEIDAKGTGNLINTARADVELKEYTVSLMLEVLEYWQWVENGRSPSRTTGWDNPIDDLSQWLTSKIQRGKFMPLAGKTLPTTQNEIRNVSWAIYKKITKKGYERIGDKAMPLQRTIDGSHDLIKEFADVVAQQIGDELYVEFATLNNPRQGKKLYGAKRTRLKV